MNKKTNRRAFLARCTGLAAAAGAVSLGVQAEEMPKVDEAGPQAGALGYKHDAAAVDTAKYSNFVAGSNCGNCQLYLGADAEWGGCGIFPGQAVNSAGWCSAWVKKAG